MAAERIHYRKLPGQRRGLINGSSVWLGPDHLLLVKSQRFKEEYKRYYLRDIQAIAIARSGRFHLSSRSLFLGALWFIAFAASLSFPGLVPLVWTVALLLVFGWLYISVDRSCVCRIYTAVSSDPLPSVYRTWTARKFLAAVEPRIRQVQGEFDPAWLATEDQRAGPEPEGGAAAQPAATVTSILDAGEAGAEAAPARSGPAGAMRTPASDVFLAALLLEAVVDALAFRQSTGMLTWAAAAIAVVQCLAAVFIFIDRSRGRLRSGVHNVAIAKLIWLTLLFYMDAGYNAATRSAAVPLAPATGVLRGLDLAVTIGLLAAGLMVSSRRETPPPGVTGN